MSEYSKATLLSLNRPKWLSLVKAPANRVGFKVIRSKSEEGSEMAHGDRNIRVRNKRSDPAGVLLSIMFPVGVDQAEAEEMMDQYGLGEDYTLQTMDDGQYIAVRTGEVDDSIGDGSEIDLGGGLVANVAVASRSDNTVSGVTLTALEFSDSFGDVDEVKEWLEEREIDFKPGAIQNYEGGYAVQRHDTPEEVETRKVKLDVGVTGFVAKTQDMDVPKLVYRSVIEQSYGNWGWGHLDFASALMDPAFSDASWDAIYVLRDVLYNVVLNSGLPLDDRKTLVENACRQFTQYISGLIDALPRGVFEQANANSKQNQTEDTSMAGKTIKRNDDKRAEADDVEGQSTQQRRSDDTADDTKDFVTRSELKEVVSGAVAEAMTAHQRSDDGPSDDKDVEESSANKELLLVVQGLKKTMDTLVSDVGGLKSEVKDLGGDTNVTRDDDEGDEGDHGDAASDGDGRKEKTAKRSDDSPFTGMFGNRFG